MTGQNTRFDSMWIVVPLALLMYVIPWVTTQSTMLWLGAYDLAELLSKRPLVDSAYWIVFALRAHLVLLTWLVALGCNRPAFTRSWWLHVIFSGVLIIAQWPPLTFLADTTDVNQTQQAILTFVSLVGAGIGYTGFLWERRQLFRTLIAFFGVPLTLYGMTNGLAALQSYNLEVSIGVGGIGLTVIYGLLALISAMQASQR